MTDSAWTPVGATYVPQRSVWRVLFARYTQDGWQFSERVEDVDDTMLRSERGRL